MKISIVIPAYNEEKYIGKTLESVKKLETDDWEIEVIVVDGGSRDKTAEIAKKYGAKVVRGPHKGIGFTRQLGLLYAKGEIVVSTDADTIVPANWLVCHVKALSQPKVILSYGNVKVLDGTFPYYHYINYIQPHLLWVFHHLFRKPIPGGQNLAFWRNKALEMGGFDKKLELMEDIDFVIRMMKAGKAVFLPDLIVFSSGRRSAEGWRFFFRTSLISVKYFLFGKQNLGSFPDFR